MSDTFAVIGGDAAVMSYANQANPDNLDTNLAVLIIVVGCPTPPA